MRLYESMSRVSEMVFSHCGNGDFNPTAGHEAKEPSVDAIMSLISVLDDVSASWNIDLLEILKEARATKEEA